MRRGELGESKLDDEMTRRGNKTSLNTRRVYKTRRGEEKTRRVLDRVRLTNHSALTASHGHTIYGGRTSV